MKNILGKTLTFLLIISISLGFLSPLALGAELDRIPVKLVLTGALPQVDEEYQIFLEADDRNNPMPISSENGLYSLIVEGEDQVFLPGISFSSLGVYSYSLWLKAGDNELASYDKTIYKLVVHVTRGRRGGLEETVLLYKGGKSQSHKEDQVEFVVDYEEPIQEVKPIEPEKPIEEEEEPIEEEPEEEEEPKVEEEEPLKEEKAKLPSTGEEAGGSLLYISGLAMILGFALVKKDKKA